MNDGTFFIIMESIQGDWFGLPYTEIGDDSIRAMVLDVIDQFFYKDDVQMMALEINDRNFLLLKTIPKDRIITTGVYI